MKLGQILPKMGLKFTVSLDIAGKHECNYVNILR